MRYHQWKLVGFDNFSIKSGSRGVTFVWDKGALCVYFGVSVVSIWGNWPCIKSQNVPISYSWRKITGCWNYGVLEKNYRGITSCDCNYAVDEINYADVMLVLPFRVVSSELWSYLRMAPPRLFRVYDSRERYRSITETKMSSFWWNLHHWLHRKLSKWQLSVQPVMKLSSKWRHFRFSFKRWRLGQDRREMSQPIAWFRSS